MVQLGFIKNLNSLPEGFWVVRFEPAQSDANKPFDATINGVRCSGGKCSFELVLNCPAGKSMDWVEAMARKLSDMDLNRFVLDVRSLAETMRLPLSEALEAWGFPFFEHYAMDAVVLLPVGGPEDERSATRHAADQWTRLTGSVRCNPDLDCEAQQAAAPPSPKSPLGLLRSSLSRFRSKQL